MRTPLLLLVILAIPLTTANAQAIRPLPGMPTPRRSAAECVGVVAPDSGTPGFRRAQLEVLVLPPRIVPRSLRGQKYTVRSRVNTNGVVDSVEITGGKVDKDFFAEWMSTLRSARYVSAEYQQCAVVDWNVFTVDFTPRGGKKPDAGTPP